VSIRPDSDAAHRVPAGETAGPDDEHISGDDRVELVSVGVDIGSSTSHLVLSRVVLRRLGQQLSSRFVVTERVVLYRSPVHLTPYGPEYTIDSDALGALIVAAYAEAGIAPADVDTGAVILTGEAVKRHNSRAIASLFAGEAGAFVCASAGPHLEAVMAAHGSGAVGYSRDNSLTLLVVDIGGGTTKFAIVTNGAVTATWHVEVGGRLVAVDDDDRVIRAEPAGVAAGREIGTDIGVGRTLPVSERQRLGGVMAQRIHQQIVRAGAIDALVVAGGVAEFVHGREARDFGDLGAFIAAPLTELLRTAGQPIVDTGEGIRATALGLAQYTIQASGSTLLLAGQDLLPLHGLRVIAPLLGQTTTETAISRAVKDAISSGLGPDEGRYALAIRWDDPPRYASLRSLAQGILAGTTGLTPPPSLILVFERDIGRVVASIIRDELSYTGSIVSIDGISVGELDHIDLGRPLMPAGVIPVVVKSLFFPDGGAPLATYSDRSTDAPHHAARDIGRSD
jgi:ethanolamine utilization protein EutA